MVNKQSDVSKTLRNRCIPALVGEFHLHIDAQTLSKSFENFLVENQKFWNSDFSGYPEQFSHRPPKIHLNKKTKYAQELRSTFNALINYIKDNPKSIEGYIEAEYIPVDIDIEEKPFNPQVEIPLVFQNSSLLPGTFRQDEVHITLLRDSSDQRLLNSLRNMGFYSVYMEKPFGEVEIFTVQGTRRIIRQVLPKLITYLRAVGGATKCSIKEERIISWWASSSELSLPCIISSIA
ncbi:hypothetical protein [Nostoc sp. FACHB-888]|uniref:hypothetical protein n=1 Tax=Nostoc sp. FACHB-888 TaxID=2692842 RepID=UPI00168294D6|nr:hypothetical protein [Nostoc sp. FACHB-888]MBD2248714.1 hypothetical protein [Nostoc sp. FACHB-888]